MSKVICGLLKLTGDASKDAHLNEFKYEILFSQQSFAETTKLVETYLKKEGLRERAIKLKYVDVIHSEGDVVSPVFTGGPTASVRERVVPLAFSVIHYDETSNKFNIVPIGLELKTKIGGDILTSHIAFYLPLPSIYPFTITRFYKILYTRDVSRLVSLLRTVYLADRGGEEYKAIESLLITTQKKLKIPQKPTISCAKDQKKKYYVVYRCQRSFSSAVIAPENVDYLCKIGNGIIIDHHVVILEISRGEPAFYYNAILNYLLYKTVNNNLGTLHRNQFARPLLALIEVGLEWNEEEWQYKVAELSRTLSDISRKLILRYLGLPQDLVLAELVDRGMDIKVKQSRERVEGIFDILSNLSEWKELVEIIDQNIDEKRLLESLATWVVEK